MHCRYTDSTGEAATQMRAWAAHTHMPAVVMIFEVPICWSSTAVTAVGCSDALEPGGCGCHNHTHETILGAGRWALGFRCEIQFPEALVDVVKTGAGISRV